MDDGTGYLLGRVVGVCLFPLLVLAIIGLVQYARTRDWAASRRVMRSWWALALLLLCYVVTLLGQLAQNLR